MRNQFVDLCVIDEICPNGCGDLDTGWECSKCGFDGLPIKEGLRCSDKLEAKLKFSTFSVALGAFLWGLKRQATMKQWLFARLMNFLVGCLLGVGLAFLFSAILKG